MARPRKANPHGLVGANGFAQHPASYTKVRSRCLCRSREEGTSVNSTTNKRVSKTNNTKNNLSDLRERGN